MYEDSYYVFIEQLVKFWKSMLSRNLHQMLPKKESHENQQNCMMVQSL